MNPEEAYQYAMKNKQYIQFPKEEQANWFSNNGYKKGKQYKMGGNPYAKGGRAQVLNYLLNDLFQEDDTKNSTVSAPTVEEVSNPDNSDEQQQRDDILRQAREQQDYDLSLQIAMGTGRGNPYNDEENPPSLGSKVGNPYLHQLLLITHICQADFYPHLQIFFHQ